MKSSRAWCAKTAELLALAALLVGAAAPAGTWAIFAPRDGHFSVELPGAPAVERDSHWTPVGSIAMTKYWLRAGDALLAVELHDIPAVAEARDSLVRDVGGTLIESRTLEFSGAPARDFRYRLRGAAPLDERVLAVLMGTRLYLVTGMARAPASNPEVAHLFASFRCWREGGSGAAGPP
jgi:hypothetical protein